MENKRAINDSETFQDWATILELGRYAPTPHNTQWYYLHPINETAANVCIDESIKLPFTDPEDQFRITGLGVFVRHLEMSAEAAGFKLESVFKARTNEYLATVKIIGKQQKNQKLANLIKKRQTSRRPYEKQKVSLEAIKELTGLSTTANMINISTDGRIVRSVLNLNNEVLMNDLKDKGIGDELNRWIRYTKKSRANHHDGFTPATLVVPAWKAWLVFRFQSISRLSIINKILTSQYFKQNTTATVGWIYGPLNTRQNQYDAGRLMMDLWIKSTEYGYYMQPYGSIITNNHARSAFLQSIELSETDDKMVWLAFRIGTSTKPAVSPRKSVEEYMR